MALAIASGEIDELHVVELQALAEICDRHFLPAEAARVRRWMEGT